MKPPRAGMGRPMGSKNKSTTAVKTLLLAVNDKLGGEAAMLQWAQENPTEFYKLLGRLIPQEVDHSGTIEHEIKQIERTIRRPEDRDGGGLRAASPALPI